MTVIFSKKCELGLQAVLFLSVQEKDKKYSATAISKAIKAPKEFVSKVLQELAQKKIVGSKKGKNGGFYLGKAATEIRLIDIVEAIDGLDIFHCCVLGFPGCGTGNPCPVHNVWGPIRERTFKMLSNETLDKLAKKTKNKLADYIP